MFLPQFVGGHSHFDSAAADAVGRGQAIGLADAFDAHRPTASVVVPQLLRAWVGELVQSGRHASPWLRFVAVGGAPLPPLLAAEAWRLETGMAGRIAGWLMGWVNEQPSRRAIEALDLAAGQAVLELGFGSGHSLAVMAALCSAARFTGLDQSTEMLRMACRRNRDAIRSGHMTLAAGRFASLPWGDASFDKILLLNVVYFFDQAGQDMAGVFRVLRSGGRVAVYATDRSTMDDWPFSGPDTHRTFDADQLAILLVAAGFVRRHVAIEPMMLPFGVKGLLAIAHKPLTAPSCSSAKAEGDSKPRSLPLLDQRTIGRLHY